MCSVMDLEAQRSRPLGTDGEVGHRISIRENAVGSGRKATALPGNPARRTWVGPLPLSLSLRLSVHKMRSVIPSTYQKATACQEPWCVDHERVAIIAKDIKSWDGAPEPRASATPHLLFHEEEPAALLLAVFLLVWFAAPDPGCQVSLILSVLTTKEVSSLHRTESTQTPS